MGIEGRRSMRYETNATKNWNILKAICNLVVGDCILFVWVRVNLDTICAWHRIVHLSNSNKYFELGFRSLAVSF